MKTKRIESAHDLAWIRTCQECGHKQLASQNPIDFKNGIPDSYLNAKCKKCKSESLDYGTQNASYYDDED
jgi:hypothetical protein